MPSRTHADAERLVMLSRSERQRLVEIARGRSDEPLHLLEGAKAILDALHAGHVSEVWVQQDADDERARAILDAARQAGVPVGAGTRKDFERMAQVVSPQPVLALVGDTGLPLADVASRTGLLLWLDGIQDPGNVGAVFRIAAAFGVGGVLVGTGSADPLGLKALRASVGLALSVPFARASASSIAHAVSGNPVLTLDMDGEDVRDVSDVPDDFVLVLGAEGRGIGPEAEAATTRRVGISIAASVNSLNVAVAAGIAIACLADRASQ